MRVDESVLRQTPSPWTRRQWIGLLLVVLPAMLTALDTSVLYLALPKLSTALRPSSTDILWITDIYGFMIAGFMIPLGALGDRIGRRRLLMGASTVFALASAAAAFSANAQMLIALRAIMGIAGGSLIPCSVGLISAMFPTPRDRAKAMGIWFSCFLGTMALGPLVGGMVLIFFWWGSVFLLGLPLTLVVLIVGRRYLPEFSDTSAGRVDLLSVALFLGATLPAVWGFKELAADGWDAEALLGIAAGLIFAMAFVEKQSKMAQPLLDLSLLRTGRLSVALAVLFSTSVFMGGIFIFVALYLQDIQGLSPLRAGLALLPQRVAIILANNLGPVFARRFAMRDVVAGGLVLMAAGFAMISQVPAHDGALMLIAGFSVATAGIGTIFTLLMDLVVGSAPSERAASAAAIAQTANELGMALGLAILGSIGSLVFRAHLAQTSSNAHAAVLVRIRHVAAQSFNAAINAAAGEPIEVVDDVKSAFTAGLRVDAGIGATILGLLAVIVVIVFPQRHPILDP